MIPDHLIDKAAASIYQASVFGDEFAIDAWHEKADASQVKTNTRIFALAVLNATAADIWDEGHDAGYDWGLFGADSRNPYRTSEGE